MTHPTPIYPPALKQGDKIGVFAPSCWVPEDDILSSKAFMEANGYEVYIHPQTFKRHKQSAGTAQEKVDALHDLVQDPAIKAVFGARGGNRATTMLDKIDFNSIKKNPKIFIGYSDFTALLNAIHKKTGLVTFHAPLFRELPTHPYYSPMMQALSGDITSPDLSHCTSLKDGEATGQLIGGNLSVFSALIGTPYMPDIKDNILFLEDVGDHISRYDRMFCHLKNAGILEQISGLIIGEFTDMKDSQTNPFGFSLEEIIQEHTQGLNIPILTNAPFGHGDNLCTLPVGAEITLKNGKLSFNGL